MIFSNLTIKVLKRDFIMENAWIYLPLIFFVLYIVIGVVITHIIIFIEIVAPPVANIYTAIKIGRIFRHQPRKRRSIINKIRLIFCWPVLYTPYWDRL